MNLQQKAKPIVVPCCKLKVYDYTFFHKKSCDGEVFQGEFNQQIVVVCSKCKILSFFDNFIWTCPKCLKRFRKTMKDKFDNSPVSLIASSKLSLPSNLKLNEMFATENNNSNVVFSDDIKANSEKHNKTDYCLNKGIIQEKLHKNSLALNLKKEIDVKTKEKINIFQNY